MFVPTAQWLARFRFRPWTGIVLPDGFLDSLENAEKGCAAILKVYRDFDVKVLIESPTRVDKDIERVCKFLGESLPKSLAQDEDDDKKEGDSPVSKRCRWQGKK